MVGAVGLEPTIDPTIENQAANFGYHDEFTHQTMAKPVSVKRKGNPASGAVTDGSW